MKHKASSKDKPHPMLHGQHEGKMTHEMMGKKEKMAKKEGKNKGKMAKKKGKKMMKKGCM